MEFLFTAVAVAALLLIVTIAAKVYDGSRSEPAPLPLAGISGFEVIEDLLKIIDLECQQAADARFTYQAVKYASGISHSNLNQNITILSEEVLEDTVTDTVDKILDSLSVFYMNRIAQVIEVNQIETFITDKVYINLYRRFTDYNFGKKSR